MAKIYSFVQVIITIFISFTIGIIKCDPDPAGIPVHDLPISSSSSGAQASASADSGSSTGPLPSVPVGGPPDSSIPALAPGISPPWFLGPQYIPQSWVGSALAAKGDLLFPIVIFLFVLVGVWTVVKFLLALLVPLVAKKMEIGGALLAAKALRSIPINDPHAVHQENVDELTQHILPILDDSSDHS